MNCDVGEVTKSWKMSRAHSYSRTRSPTFPSLHLRHRSLSNPSVALPTSQLILQSFRRFTFMTAHSPNFPSLHLRHNSFSNPSVASPTSQFILQPLFRFSNVTSSSVNSPGEPPMLLAHRKGPCLPQQDTSYLHFQVISVLSFLTHYFHMERYSLNYLKKKNLKIEKNPPLSEKGGN